MEYYCNYYFFIQEKEGKNRPDEYTSQQLVQGLDSTIQREFGEFKPNRIQNLEEIKLINKNNKDNFKGRSLFCQIDESCN